VSKDNRKVDWDNNWKTQLQINPQDILNARFTQEAYRCLRSFIDGKRDKLILEVGCGTGRFCVLLAKDFPESCILGLDISPNSIRLANLLKAYLRIGNVNFERGDLFRIPYPEDYFDVVFSEGVIEHFPFEKSPNYKDALKEMIRVTKSKGKVIVGVPNWYCFPHTLYKWLIKKLNKQYRYGYEKSFKHWELINLFLELGLKEIEVSAFYPSYAFYRLQKGGLFKIFYILGKLTDLVQSINNSFNESFTKKFGFEIIVKGIKP